MTHHPAPGLPGSYLRCDDCAAVVLIEDMAQHTEWHTWLRWQLTPTAEDNELFKRVTAIEDLYQRKEQFDDPPPLYDHDGYLPPWDNPGTPVGRDPQRKYEFAESIADYVLEHEHAEQWTQRATAIYTVFVFMNDIGAMQQLLTTVGLDIDLYGDRDPWVDLVPDGDGNLAEITDVPAALESEDSEQ